MSTTTNNTKLTWTEAFELDADRYVAVKDELTTFCAAIPATMTLAEAAADYASTYDGAADCVATLMVDGDNTERVEFAVANLEVR